MKLFKNELFGAPAIQLSAAPKPRIVPGRHEQQEVIDELVTTLAQKFGVLHIASALFRHLDRYHYEMPKNDECSANSAAHLDRAIVQMQSAIDSISTTYEDLAWNEIRNFIHNEEDQ